MTPPTDVVVPGTRRIEAAIRAGAGRGHPALVAFLTGGFPTLSEFIPTLRTVASAADVVEIGVPFSDPMADGVTIQRSSERALAAGVTLAWILGQLRTLSPRPRAPLVLMSYLNPLLAFGIDRLADESIAAGVSGFIVPDLPLEEAHALGTPLTRGGLALVRMVSPVTPPQRVQALCAASSGFVYAVTMTGTTGAASGDVGPVLAYLDAVRAESRCPVCAGFGIRSARQVRSLAGHTDGVIVGSALIEAIDRAQDPGDFLRSLRV